jgi:hypothetical protein
MLARMKRVPLPLGTEDERPHRLLSGDSQQQGKLYTRPKPKSEIRNSKFERNLKQEI